MDGLQFSHMVGRLTVNNAARQAEIKTLQRKLAGVCHQHSTMVEELACIEKQKEVTERELALVVEHRTTIDSNCTNTKARQFQRLDAYHTLLTDEITQAKAAKAEEIAAKDNIERLKKWLRRQREARKIMRLYIGLEELGTKRLDKVLGTIVDGLKCESLEEAMYRYKDVMARNNWLVREAEHKLQQQASLEMQLMTLMGEKEGAKREVKEDGEWRWAKRVQKVDIYHIQELSRVKSAQSSLSHFTQLTAHRELTVTEMLTQLLNLFTFLHEVDPLHCSSAPLTLPFLSPHEILTAFLVLEKKVTFFLELTEQRLIFRQRAKGKPPTEPLKQLFSKGSQPQNSEIRSRLRAQSLTRTATAAEPTLTKGLLSRVVSTTDVDDDLSPRTRLITIELPQITTACDLHSSPKANLRTVWSDSKLKKDWELLRKHSQRVYRKEKSPRIVDFMIALKENEHKLARMTADKWTASGFRTPPLKIPALSSPRSKLSTRAETGFSIKSKREKVARLTGNY